MCGEAHAHVGDDRLRLGRTLLDEVDELVAVEHTEVRRVAGVVDEPAQDRPRQSFERVVPQIRRTEFERGDPERVPPFGG